jgi:hypothetical protein
MRNHYHISQVPRLCGRRLLRFARKDMTRSRTSLRVARLLCGGWEEETPLNRGRHAYAGVSMSCPSNGTCLRKRRYGARALRNDRNSHCMSLRAKRSNLPTIVMRLAECGVGISLDMSPPRRRGSSNHPMGSWIPAFAGMTKRDGTCVKKIAVERYTFVQNKKTKQGRDRSWR